MNIQPHQQRVIDEYEQLTARFAKLVVFFDTPTYKALSQEERDLLAKQREHMSGYRASLMDRLGLWGIEV